MPIRNQFDCIGCLDAVGSYDNRASLDLADDIQFTMQLADFSKSFAAEAFEPRFLISGGATAGVGEQARVAVVATTRPVVVEDLRVRITAGISFYFGVGAPLFADEAIGGGNLKADIGGSPSSAEYFTGKTGLGVVPGSGQFSLILSTDWQSPAPFRVWIPQGEALMLACVGASDAVFADIIGREVADLPRKRVV